MTKSSPVLSRESLNAIFRDPKLIRELAALEDFSLIQDESAEFSRLVNIGESKKEALSRWVRYREGYSPKIVERLLELFPLEAAHSFVLDPMCGSGSTQIAAKRLSIKGAGADVSPYAVLVSRVKTHPLDSSEIELAKKFLERIPKIVVSKEPRLTETEDYLRAFFPEENFLSLLSIKRRISQEFDQDSRLFDFFWVCLLAIVEDCSNRRKDGNGLATRPSPVVSPVNEFLMQASTMIHDVERYDLNTVDSFTYRHSAIDVDTLIKQASTDLNANLGAIIFSPPYANSFDYYESYKLELLFGDFFAQTELPNERQNLIRSYRQMGTSEPLIDMPLVETLIREVMSRLPEKEAQTGVRDGRSRLLPNLLRGYFEDMRTFIQKAASAMPTGSYMSIVVDQSAYLGVLVPTDLVLANLGKECGLQFERLVICRKAKTSGQQLQMQPALREVMRESAVILRK